VVIFARNSKSAGRLSEAFRERKVKKEYLAICKGNFSKMKGMIRGYLIWDEKRRKAVISRDLVGKEAVTYYEVLEEFGKYSLVKLLPETGRKHQLRVHLSSMGHPIVGDEKYGGGRLFKDKILLHCYKMIVPHPVKRESIEFKAEIPDFWKEFLRSPKSIK